MVDFGVGAVTGGVTKTVIAPIERVKLIMQTQDANKRVTSGEVKRYKGIVNCTKRIVRE